MIKPAAKALLLIVGIVACLRSPPHFQDLLASGRAVLRGFDLQVVCHALDVAAAGQDPYLDHLVVYGQGWSLPYPLLYVYISQPLCLAGGDPQSSVFGSTYGIVYTLIGLISWVILWPALPSRTWDRIAALVAIFWSFGAFQVELLTGNLAILELPLVSLTVVLLAKRKYEWAGGVFGAMASLKLLPLVGAASFLFLPGGMRIRMRSTASAAAGFLAVELLNAVLFSKWFPSYLAELARRSPGGRSYEGGGPNNQNSIDFVTNAFQMLHLGYPASAFALACLGLGVGYLTALACAANPPQRRELPAVATSSLIVLVLWLFLFRQKPYSFETFIPFMLAAGYGIGRWTARGAILASVVVPAAFVSHAVTNTFLTQYYQLLAAWAAVLVIFAGLFLTGRTDPVRVPLL